LGVHITVVAIPTVAAMNETVTVMIKTVVVITNTMIVITMTANTVDRGGDQ
jgi:hypothetical protein